MDSEVYFIGNLSLRTWTLSIWPRLLLKRLRWGGRGKRCYVIEGSHLALIIARVMAPAAGLKVERLTFSLAEIRDESGIQVWLLIGYRGLAEVRQSAVSEPVFQEWLHSGLLTDRLPTFLKKNITAWSLIESGTWRSLVLAHVCAWHKSRIENGNGVPILFLERRPWLRAISRYASLLGVIIIEVPSAPDFRASLLRRLSPKFVDTLRLLRYRPTGVIRMLLDRRATAESPKVGPYGQAPAQEESEDPALSSRPKVAVQYYGQFNVDRPNRQSDLFFWQQSSLRGSDMLLVFGNARDQLDAPKLAALREHGIAAAVMHPGATTIPGVPIITQSHSHNLPKVRITSSKHNGVESRWLREQVADYHSLRSHWASLFETYNVKVFTTWYKYGAGHCAIADALQSLGGVTAVYQRSYESHPAADHTTNTDIFFGFSRSGADSERRSNSVIRYHVTTGYLGDHQFSLSSRKAGALRSRLQENGAKHILAYFDESTVDDGRWADGHHVAREDYAFLLKKLLSEPWLGLVIKPKAPRSLRRRLGPIAEVLAKAEATGRCHVYGECSAQAWVPPSAAALAADVAIHGFLYAATAGMEAALAGIPTLMLDHEGWSESPLYQLGVGNVVFTDWEGLWEACTTHWLTPGEIPGFGDWSPLLDELDPFRDGRAAQRMGEYINWLLEGFQAGLGRETVMADAAERYCARWGQENIVEVNGSLEASLSVSS